MTIETLACGKQSQQSLKEQLRELCQLGNKSGLYDAVDFINGFIHKQELIDKKQHGRCVKNGKKSDNN